MSELEQKDDDNGIARVLRASGAREKPSDELKAAVRASVHAEWRAVVARRSRRRMWIALAASVAIGALALWVGRSYLSQSGGEIVASVSRAAGGVETHSGFLHGWQAVASTQSVHSNEELRTGHDGRVALQLRDGVSLRLDHDTRVMFVDAGRIDIRSGAVYIDAGVVSSLAEHLRVGTPAGVVHHVGTQYEVRLVNGDGVTRIRVREGRVNLTPERGDVQTAQVGEQLLVSTSGEVQRAGISPADAEWQWAADAAPTFNIDGRPVREFLAWAGRELGREVVFTTPESETEADRAVLNGSVAGLSPAEALAAVLPTTRLRSMYTDGKIEVSVH